MTPVSTKAGLRALSRRDALRLGMAAAVAPLLPAIPAAPTAVAAPVKALLPAWIVGTPGEPDHEVVRALTREAALALRCECCEGDDDGLEDQPDCECDACASSRNYEATRVTAWDTKRIITDADWMAAGFDAICTRCHEETSHDAGGHVVEGNPVCECCLTLADWRVIDPERASEMEAEAADRATRIALSRARASGVPVEVVGGN